MNEVRTLIENYWINKAKDKELYIKTKRQINKYKRFVIEQLGWRLINNERILKIEKVPVHAEAYMGITNFIEIRDYCIFTALLIFLEDKEDNEQFLLSELVDMIEVQLKDFEDVDWTVFTHRKSLIRAMEFAEETGLLEVYDGSSESLSGGMEHEVLYENTGLSRYFATSFGYDISEFTSYKDFEKEQQQEVETDRGHFRINRVYRQLVSAPAMYWIVSDNQDSIYVKNQRQWVQKNLDDNLGGRLHLHRNAAFFVMYEENCFGDRHPREAMISELVLIVCSEIRERVIQGILLKEINDCVHVSDLEFKKIINVCKEKYDSAWSKEYREMDIDKLVSSVKNYMENWMLIKVDSNRIVIYPAVGKFIGKYPKDFKLKEADKHE